MAVFDLVNLSGLMDDAKCFAFVRQHRWLDGVRRLGCGSSSVGSVRARARASGRVRFSELQGVGAWMLR